MLFRNIKNELKKYITKLLKLNLKNNTTKNIKIKANSES